MSIFDRLASHIMGNADTATAATPEPFVPVHWLDTTPQKSTDKPCGIRSLDVKVHVSGLYADVTETLVIANPNKRDLSVGIAIRMPDRAVVRGYALEIDGNLIDGVVVPKEKARVAFETEQRRGADPGLVEAVKGNVYRTRVYPVSAGRTRTLQLRYVSPLILISGTSAFLDVPIPAEHVEERSIRIDVELIDCSAPEISGLNDSAFSRSETYWSIESKETDVKPSSGIRVALPKLPASFALLERDDAGEVWFAASEAVPTSKTDSPLPALSCLTVLWDTSGSRAGISHASELSLLRAWCSDSPLKAFRLISFANEAEPVRTFESADDLFSAIEALRYDGGTDFTSLARELATLPAAEGEACVLFTDGLDTLSGETISLPCQRKIMAVVSGTERDVESLRQACGGLAFDVATAPGDFASLTRVLFASNLLAGVDGEGIAEVLGIGSGADGRFAVIGRLTASSTAITFANTGTQFTLDSEDAKPGSTISHAWAALRVSQLSPRADDNAEELLSLGRRFGVVSPATSLLVLESIDQWLRYDIEPPATWTEMHEQWERLRPGKMNLSSPEAEADRHLANLKRAWAELKDWWARDWSAPVATSGVCPNCGSPVGDARFCPRCGERLDTPSSASRGNRVMRAAAGAVMGISSTMSSAMSAPQSASSHADFSAEDSAVADAAMERASIMSGNLPDEMLEALEAAPDSADEPSTPAPEQASPSGAIKVRGWKPDAEYLKALDEALLTGISEAENTYFAQRPEYAASPSFFIDSAGWFLSHDDRAFGIRVLTNLAELRIEDAALLRVMAWRLREAGELSRALVILHRVLKLRPEDSQSHRDVALVLDELARETLSAGDEAAAKAQAEDAGAFYRKIALTPWQRRAKAIGLFAVEEYNVLRAWAADQKWESAPELESLGEELEGVLDCDLRVTLAWDADETDVDLHVTEPSGEEAYYGHRLTHSGGRISEDITDGYGPELYEIRKAKEGEYAIRAHYYASHQQTVFGPATCTLTVYTDWGRPNQAKQITSTRLEDAKQMLSVGTAFYGAAAIAKAEEANEDSVAPAVPSISKGSSVADLIAAYGTPARGDADTADGQLAWDLPGNRTRMAFIEDGKVVRIVESMPWGEQLVVMQ